MSQEIRLGAVVVRDGRLWLKREHPSGHWELPGGALLPEHPDVDEAMDRMLSEHGISAPAIEEDFVETIYLRREGRVVVYNLYAPSEWSGEPGAAPGVGSGWFALGELDAVAMESTVRDAVLAMFGFRERPDDALRIMQALSGTMGNLGGDAPRVAAEPLAEPQPAPGDRRAAGLDVLRTLRGGGDPGPAFEQMRERQPGIAEDIVDFALGEVWSHPALDRRTRSLQVVAMLAALGGRTGPLGSHVRGALNHGATPEELAQTMRMVAVYAGFPAALEAWSILVAALEERGLPIPRGPA